MPIASYSASRFSCSTTLPSHYPVVSFPAYSLFVKYHINHATFT